MRITDNQAIAVCHETHGHKLEIKNQRTIDLHKDKEITIVGNTFNVMHVQHIADRSVAAMLHSLALSFDKKTIIIEQNS